MTVDMPHGWAGRTSCGAKIRLGLSVFLMGWMAVATVAAQEPDSLDVIVPSEEDSLDTGMLPEADSVGVIAQPTAVDTTRPGMPSQIPKPVGFAGTRYGTALMDSLPVRLGALDLAEVLGDLPGAFLYRFATPGWPDGWSPAGLPPHRSTLALDDVPLTHVFTGRPGFDIAPLAFIEPPRLALQRFGRPAAVSLQRRSFATRRPLTEMKYWKGGDGLESIDVVHAQNRRMSIFGTAGLLNLMGTYSGRGADGEYPGSELHRGRQVQVRLRYEQPRWSAEVHEMHTRRSVGAHGGVIPDETGFESVYNRVTARVEHPQARRRLIRNDLAATARLRLFGTVTTLGAHWTAEFFRFRDVADTVATASDRLGLRLSQPLPGGLTVEFQGWTESVAPRFRFAAEPLRRTELHATVRDSVVMLGWTAAAAAGAHAYEGAVHARGFIELARRAGRVRLTAGAALSGEPASAVERMGFLSLGAGAFDRAGRVAEAFAQFAWEGGPFDVSLRTFGSRTTDPRDLYMATDYQAVPDSASVLVASSPMLRAGATITIGWRRAAERGIYGLLQPSVVRLLNDGDSDLHTRSGRSLPDFFGRARLGARYVLFRGDLDLDVFAEAHIWSGTTGRALHPETGLLAVPMLGALEFGPSSMINVGAEAGVREATFFAIFENVLSGSTLLPGNLIVPVYPLPAQRFRFGVHWPIFD